MAYGEIKVDTITFTDGGIDKSVTISGLVQNPTFSGNITVTGTISGNTVRGQTISGVTVTGTTAQFTSGTFTTITGGVATITSGVFASGNAAGPSVSVGTTTNGIYSPATNQIAIATSGTGRLFVDASGRIGIGTNSPSELFHVAGVARIGADNTSDAELQIGMGATGNRNAYIDLIGDTTYTDYGLRLIRTNGGANGDSLLAHRGTGTLFIGCEDAGNIGFRISGTERARIDSSGRLLVGGSTYIQGNTYTTGNLLNVFGGSGAGPQFSTYSADAFALGIDFSKSRSSSIGTGTIVQNGDALGNIIFNGYDSTSYKQAATIAAVVDGTPGANDMPGRLVFSTTADGASSPTERMRITNTGATNVFASTANVLGAGSDQAAGTTYYLFYGANNASSTTTGTTCFLVFTNGNVQNTNNSYAGISDAKLKENIVDATSQWSDIKALQVRKYNFKEGQTHTQIGLVAQEVELVSPGLVTESPDRDAEGNDLGTVTKSVNYSVLYMKAVKALQEAMERIEQLETSNADLLARVTALETA